MAAERAIDKAMRASYVVVLDRLGRKCCAFCRTTPLSGRQQRWCSKRCVAAAMATWDFRIARSIVERRDRGICARCGLDTAALGQALAWYAEWLARDYIWRGGSPLLAWSMTAAPFADLKRALKIPSDWMRGHDLWECNHILALAEGGRLCDLANLETLCQACHREHTAELVGRLAKAKRRSAKFTYTHGRKESPALSPPLAGGLQTGRRLARRPLRSRRRFTGGA